jgi:hypothetical protein
MRHNFNPPLLALSLATWSLEYKHTSLLPTQFSASSSRSPTAPLAPLSPKWQLAALQEFVGEIFHEVDGVETSFGNFISQVYIQQTPFLKVHGGNSTFSVLLHVFGEANITILQIMFDSLNGMSHCKFVVLMGLPSAFMDLWRFNGMCMEEH